MTDIYTHITVQDLTSFDRNPSFPRNVTLCVSPNGDVHLLGILNHQTKLGIDSINAALLIRLLKPIAEPGYDARDYVDVVWQTDDVLCQRPDLTTDQAREVIQRLSSNHDAEFGINWETIDCVADGMFPEPDNLNELRMEADES